MTNIEIERQFILRALPDEVVNQPGTLINQGYFLPEAVKACEIRVRQKGEAYYLTIKGSGLMMRTETEVPLTKEQFTPLWLLTEGRRIEKTRREMSINGFTVEVDEHHGRLKGLIVAEIEFKSEAEANHFTPPEWFGEEVTHQGALKNGNLARSGLPKEYQYLLR